MDEATQLHFMLLAQAQLELLDGQALITLRRMRRKIRRQPRSCWVRSWLLADKLLLYGYYDRLMYELRIEDQASFFNFLRMPPEMFDELLARIAPRIQKQDTRVFFQPLHHALLLFFCQGTVELGLLAPVARHAGNAGLARDTGSVTVYVALLGLGGLRQGCLRLEAV